MSRSWSLLAASGGERVRRLAAWGFLLTSCAGCFSLEGWQLGEGIARMMPVLPLMVAVDRFVDEKGRAPNDLEEVYAFAAEAGIEVAPHLLEGYSIGLTEQGESALFFTAPSASSPWLISLIQGETEVIDSLIEELGMAMGTVGLDLEFLEAEGSAPVLIARGSWRGLSFYVALRASDGELLYELCGLQGDYKLGSSFSRIEDLDGDGHEDWIVQGIARADRFEDFPNGESVVLVHSGRTGQRLRVDRRPSPCARADCRAADLIAACGDPDADSPGDYAAVDRCGELRLVSGASGETLRSVDLSRALEPLAEVPPPPYQPGRWPAGSITWIGDVDGDRFPDLAVGTPSARPLDPGAEGTGAIFLISGRSLEPIDVVFGLGGGHAEMPGAVASMGDMDADGVEDFAFSAHTPNDLFNHMLPEVSDPLPYVALVSGKTRELIWRACPFHESGYPSGFGRALASLPDRNADGIRDVAIGWQDATGPNGEEGAIALLSGADGSAIETLTGGSDEYWCAALESVEGHGLFLGNGRIANGLEFVAGSIRRVSEADEWVWKRNPSEAEAPRVTCPLL